MERKQTWKQVGANALLEIAGIGFALGVAEIALRLVGISYPSFYQVDRHRGHALIPNFSGDWTHEGRGRVEINQDGLRDREHSLIKARGQYRIAVLGDSFSEAIQVNAEQTFWAELERNLATCKNLQGKTVEVINFGVGDYGTAQQLMTLRHHVWQYEPDLILLQIFTGNDLVNNSPTLSPGDRLAPFLIQKDGQWVMDQSFNQSQTYRRRDGWPRRALFTLINHSRVLQVLNEAKRVITTRRTLVGSTKNQDIIPALDFDVNLYQEPTSPDWQMAWNATETLIRQIHQETQAKKADFVAVTLSNPPQVYPDLSVRKRLQGLGATDLFYPDRRIAQLGKNEGFPVISLAQSFQKYSDDQQVFLHGFENTVQGIGHWNAEGHHLAGQLISQQLCPKIRLNP